MKKNIIYFVFFAIILLLFSCPPPGGKYKDIVTITDMTTHYRVVIDAEGRSHYEIGQDYARETLQILPGWEEIVDLYIWEMDIAGFDYADLLERANDIKTQIPDEYLDELEGFYSMLSNTAVDVAGDGKLSKDVMSYDGIDDLPDDMDTGDLYNSSTQQCIIFQPQTMTLEIYFRARNGDLEDDPVFESVTVDF